LIHELPRKQEEALRRGRRLAWVSIVFFLSASTALYFVQGNSQAIRAAWLEDLLSLLPPISFLISARVAFRDPDRDHPYGYRRASTIAFLVGAVALSGLGFWLLIEAAIRLFSAERVTIGSVSGGIWLGWAMIGALAWSAIPSVFLGRAKLPVAEELHDKAMHADGNMNKADWVSGSAGILGILGLGMGWWWADSVAAGVISFGIVADGLSNLHRAVLDLMDAAPTTVEASEPHPLRKRLLDRLKDLDWIRDVRIRLREEGHVFFGEILVVPRDDENLLERVEEAAKVVRKLDWRLQDVVVAPIPALPPGAGDGTD
jgi:cation diffusion facilitator family transporter